MKDLNDTYQSKEEQIISTFSKNTKKLASVGLLTGLSGGLVLIYTHEKCLPDKIFHKRRNYILDKIIKQLPHILLSSYSSGLSGVGWMFEYLEKYQFIETNTNKLLEDFDTILASFLETAIKRNGYDFLHGSLGITFYFLSRIKKNEKLLSTLQKSLIQLDGISEPHLNGSIKWKSIIDHQNQKTGYNISLSHGMSSIVVILSKLYTVKNIDQEKVSKLITEASNYILAQEIDKDKYGSYFPNFAIESHEILYGSRLAWCYGDLGVAMALWQAGNALRNEVWKNKALEVLLFAAEKRRNLEINMVRDAGLCHGTAGIGHVFYRMWWNTRMPEFKDAADYWFAETLKMAKFEDGLAGFKAFRTPEYGGPTNEYGLLEGIAGIGLALLTYYYEVEPTWDECLLLS